MAIPDEVLTELRAKFRRVCVIPFGKEGIDIAIRAPSRAEYKSWRAQKERPDAQEDSMRLLVVYVNGTVGDWPTVVAAFDKLLEEWPGLTDNMAMAKAFSDFTGLSFAESGKA
jgi:hypothetical protein